MAKYRTFDEYVKARQVRAAEPVARRRIIKLDSANEELDGRLLDLTKGSFYWAYGSNLNPEAMAARCPGAIKIAPLALNNGALVFRGVADVVNRKHAKVHGGLWWINRNHEDTLDRYEGVNSRFYLKRYVDLHFKDVAQPYPCLYYVMAMRRGIAPPSEDYLNLLADGYRYFGLPLEALDKALMESWQDKTWTPILRQRHKRRGGKLAQSLDLNGPAYGEGE
jgi:hypothetical protein